MDVEELRELFIAEPDFCPSCGAILILPLAGETVTCKLCTFSISISNLIGRVTEYSMDITPRGAYLALKMDLNKGSELGQMDNDRECSKCGNLGMYYTTMQLRSADEGQTIFYICSKCK
nr:DNA-directed RNA polymerase I subunit RPA12-like [Cherax quadricarinatus]